MDGVLGVDFDEVMLPLLDPFSKWHNAQFGTKVQPSDLTSYDWSRIFGCPWAEVQIRYHQFHATGQGYTVYPLPGAAEALRLIRSHLRKPPVITTGRLASLAGETAFLADWYFPDVFAQVWHGDHFGPTHQSKPALCQQAGVTVLVEDQLGHAEACARAGIRVLLFGQDYGWNQGADLHPNIVRTPTWQDVLRELGLS